MVLREHLRSVRGRKQNFDGPKDYVKYYVLRLFVLFVFVLSHLYDYISYPIYFVIYHPWLLRRYKKSDHARLEIRKDCVLYHSVEEPTPINMEVKQHNLTTMDAIFDYVRTWKINEVNFPSYAVFSSSLNINVMLYSARPRSNLCLWQV